MPAPKARKTTATRRRRRRPHCCCTFGWGVEVRLLPTGEAVAWVPHEAHCPLAKAGR
jgi:hypothetical protein